MTKPMWPASGEKARHHGRLDVIYEKGEIPGQYGLARRCKDGTLEFLCEHSFSISWEKDMSMVKKNPYPVSTPNPNDEFCVNFRKKSSPVKIGKRISKYNFEIKEKT